MKFNEKQLEAINSRTNTLVKAAAGSGKTSVLAERYIRLIEEGCHPSEIVSLTFTKKAATEMYERIYSRLLALHATNPNMYTGEALDEFSSHQISTLDSFCAGILRDHASLLGLSPQFSIDDEQVKGIIQEKLEDYVLEFKFDPIISSLLKFYGFEELISEILMPIVRDNVAIHAKHESFLVSIHNQFGYLREEVKRLIPELETGIGHLLAFESSTKTMEQNALVLKVFLLQIRGFDPEKVFEYFLGLEGQTLSKRGSNTKDESKLLYFDAIDSIKPLLEQWKALVFSLAQEKDQKEFAYHLDHITNTIRQEKRRAAILEYKDLLLSAKSLLLDHSSIADNYRRLVKYIMIDEFQDNNSDQRDLLFLLAAKTGFRENRIPLASEIEDSKLFFVGDEKQSIYRFRGADVEVFHNLQNDLSHALDVTMDQNFRSCPELIDFFNQLFTPLLRKKEFNFEAEYEEVKAESTQKALASQPVQIYYVDRCDSEEEGEQDLLSDEDSAAFYLLQEIKQLKQEHSSLHWSDFAVLSRDSNRLRNLERMFLRMGVPFQSPDPFSLFSEAPALDLFSLCQLLVGINEKAAFASILRSPLVLFSDDSLLSLLALWNDENITDTLQGLEQSKKPSLEPLTPEELNSLIHFAQFFRRIRDQLDEMRNSQIITSLWYESGYKQAIASNPRNSAYVDHGEYLIEYAKQYDDFSFLHFVTQWNQDLNQNNRVSDLEVFGMKEDGVHLMTIHRSKGLEFPIVFIAGIQSSSKSNLSSSQLYQQGAKAESYFNLWGKRFEKQATFFFTELERLEKAQSEAELKRLLYVAVTRAKVALYFFGAYDRQSSEKEFFTSLQSLLLRGLGVSQESLEEAESPLLGVKIKPVVGRQQLWSQSSRESIRTLDSSLIQAHLTRQSIFQYQESKKHWDASGLQQLYSQSQFQSSQSDSRVIMPDDGLGAEWGDLVHLMLEELLQVLEFNASQFHFFAKESLDDRWISRILTKAKLVQALERYEKRNPGSKKPSALRLETIVQDFLQTKLPNSSNPQTEINQEVKVHTEWGLDLALDFSESQKIVHCQLDLVLDLGHEWLLIDYKTDKHLDPSNYEIQQSLYALALKSIEDKPVRAFLYSVENSSYISLPIQPELELIQIIQTIILDPNVT
jgi:ATP-dependent exoDNAse (exonuclease V) beta subunit